MTDSEGELSWPEYLKARVMPNITRSSIGDRLDFIQHSLLIRLRRHDLPEEALPGLLHLVFLTYTRYQDRESRLTVLEVLKELNKWNAAVFQPTMATALTREVERTNKQAPDGTFTTAAAHRFTLLTWVNLLLSLTFKDTDDIKSSENVSKLTKSQAILLSGLAEEKRKGIRNSAFSDTRRCIRQNASFIPALIDILVGDATTITPSYRNTVLVGTVVDCALRLKGKKIDGKAMVEQKKADLIQFYLQSVISSKTAVPTSAMVALNDFVRNNVTEADFEKNLMPVLEKMMLRAPELVLRDLAHMMPALSFDPSAVFAKKLVEPLLNHMRSTSASSRTDAVLLWQALCRICHDESHLSTICTNAGKVLTSGKVTSWEHRVLVYQSLASLSASGLPEVSQKAIEVYLTMVAKESNEQALSVAIQGLGNHISVLTSSAEVLSKYHQAIDKSLKSMATGLASTKALARKAWAMALGQIVVSAPQRGEHLAPVLPPLLTALFSTFKKIADKPLAFKDGPLEAYILIAIVSGYISSWATVPANIATLLKNEKYPNSILACNTKPSFFLLDRVYTKAITADEGRWFVLSLESVLTNTSLESLEKNGAVNSVAQAIIWAITSQPEHSVRREAYDATKRLAQKVPEKSSEIIRTGLNTWLRDIENQTKDSVAFTSLNSQDLIVEEKAYRLSRVLTAISSFDPSLDIVIKERELMKSFILSHHQYIVSPNDKYNWITLLQRASVNPGSVVENHVDILREMISSNLADINQSKLFYQAAISSTSTIVFVAPAATLDVVMEMIHGDLDAKQLKGIGQQGVAIWQTPEDQVYVDVLKRGNKNAVEDRNRKDYAEKKWEQSVRDELAKKKGVNAGPKLTKEEQATLDAQRRKEKEIRSNVQKVHDSIVRGLHLVTAIVDGNTGEVAQYLVELIRLITKLASRNAGALVGESIFDTYIHIGRCTDESLETIRTVLGVATLRSMKFEPIPDRWTQESLLDLVLRVLYRLRFITERAPLSSSSFAYCFPLLHRVITESGIACDKKTEEGKESALEQITIAVDIIGFHCTNGAESLLPRQEMIESLLLTIKEFPQCAKTAKTSLVDLCDAMGELASPSEINILLQGVLSGESLVRVAALNGLEPLDLTDIDYSDELWIACHDDEEVNAKLAKQVWDENAMDVDENYADTLLNYLVHDTTFVRIAAGKAFASAAQIWPDTVIAALRSVFAKYSLLARPLVPEYDEFGMVKPESLNRQDPWEARTGLAMGLKEVGPHIDVSNVQSFINFLIQDQGLGDRHETVRQRMLEAGLSVVNAFGPEHVQVVLAPFEEYLSGNSTSNSETEDYIRQGVVILYGAAAGYLEPGDPKVRNAVDKLIETLDTPSEAVQSAVADCLPNLIKMIKDDAPKLIEILLEKLVKGEKYAHRRGAAFGLAGVVKGRGIIALKEYGVMQALKDAVDNKKVYQYRQGALFAFETLSQTLGRLFEPYVIQVLPMLLTCFGDSNAEVREATSDAARVIMSKISGHCVKLILPTLLAGLDDRQWRAKKGSVELLGSMAYCAPKQLSISLPTIVPRITEVLADSHAQVQSAANKSLMLFGEVISNPEIQQLVPVLLDALSDPNKKTKSALTALLQTAFVHYIDSPSLALVIPILERGLKERSTEIKTKSAQIVGNMSSLTDQKDLVPYLPRLMPGVKEVLVDPVPDARATAAKALGSLVEKLGEDNFPDLVSDLIDTLKVDGGGVDRQGAAQGLSEVLAGLGLERLDGLLPEIIANADSPRSYVREGFISLLIYLPATFGTRFQPYLGRIIPPILMGLADESEFVRDASLRAGRMIVMNYATKAVDLLLPELEKGLFDDNWRIRQSSVQLVGDLLFRITGQTNKATAAAMMMDDVNDKEEDDEEEAAGPEPGKKALLDVLGKDKRDRVLAALYIVRQDTSGLVRQASLIVWKSIVSNTPRTLKDILPVMMSIIIRNLASPSYDRRTVAARTLGDLVRKLGESILLEILPILEEGLESTDEDTRQGVSIALSEIMATAGRVQVNDYVDSIIPSVRKALCDSSAEVREAAAQAFDTLHQCVGPKAIDEILPTLLNMLQSSDENSVHALEALKEIMAVRANVVFPVLIPTLITTPISAFNARALGSLATVAGSALNRRITTILNALMNSLSVEEDEETIQQLKDTTRSILLSIEDEEGLHTLMAMLQEYARSDNPIKRTGACETAGIFYSESKLDASRYVSDWFRILISLFDDRIPEVVKAAWTALASVSKSVKKDDLDGLVSHVRRAVKAVGVAGVDVPGFCLPKGISPVLPIFLNGLMYGSTDIREQSALGVGDLISRTSGDALKPFVTQITGPLIRIMGDRYPPQVKAAILQTLGMLLSKVPTYLKPFLPQLQRTFIKSLTDPSSGIVRARAGSALGILISLQTRVDPLISELVSGIKTAEPGVKETMMNALQTVVEKAGSDLSDASKKGVLTVMSEGLGDHEDGTVVAAARLLGCVTKSLSSEETKYIIQTHVLIEQAPPLGSTLAVNAMLVDSPSQFEDLGITDDILEKTLNDLSSEKPKIPEAAILALGKFLMTTEYQRTEIIEKISKALADIIGQKTAGVGESRRLALVVVRAVGRRYPGLLEPYLDQLVPPTMGCVRDRNIPVKLTAERAVMYLFRLLEGEETLQSYLSTVDATAQRSIGDYHRRILSKLVSQEQQRLSQLHGAPDEEAEEEDSEVWAVGSQASFETNDD
ncbi:translational activator of GCN4 [Umbelopsis sp. WA50703]